MSEFGLPGLTLALADRKGLLRSSQYGFADVKAGLKVTPQTLFEIGSISKSFVAIAVLQLAEEGKLDLHKPVTNYLPWLKIDSKLRAVYHASLAQSHLGSFRRAVVDARGRHNFARRLRAGHALGLFKHRLRACSGFMHRGDR